MAGPPKKELFFAASLIEIVLFTAASLRPLESLGVEGLVRLWAHEALRLFQDRSVQWFG